MADYENVEFTPDDRKSQVKGDEDESERYANIEVPSGDRKSQAKGDEDESERYANIEVPSGEGKSQAKGESELYANVEVPEDETEYAEISLPADRVVAENGTASPVRDRSPSPRRGSRSPSPKSRSRSSSPKRRSRSSSPKTRSRSSSPKNRSRSRSPSSEKAEQPQIEAVYANKDIVQGEPKMDHQPRKSRKAKSQAQQNGAAEVAELEFHEGFKGKGRGPGIEVWRIENFEPVPQDSSTHGKFYNGDAYIILSSISVGRSLAHDIHFWIGKKSSQDESGSAAILAVELDYYLGEEAVQHREVQGHESKLFLGYFKKGMRYLEGGVKTGFNKGDNKKKKRRLFQCKGKHTVRVEQVALKCASLNQSDVFILEDGPQLYVWIGPKSSRMERLKGIEMARQIRDDDRAGRAQISIIEKDWNTNASFFKALGSRDKVIKTTDPSDDAYLVRKLDQEVALYKIFSENDKYRYTEVALRPLSKKLLDSKNCYALDSGYSGLYLWTGKECPPNFKTKAWNAISHFISDRGYPSWINVERVVDGGESALFKQYFPDWDEETLTRQESTGKTAEQSYDQFDARELHKQKISVENFMPDDGAGKVQVWRVTHFELRPVPEKSYGVFFGGDSYVIQYDYKDENNRDGHIIYFWQGLKSSADERGSSAIHAMKLDDDLGGQAVQIRVVMNKEPAHFLKLFKGRMVIFQTGHISGFRDTHDHDDYKKGDPLMFHIRGNDEDHVRAIQVTCRGASLNSNDVFLVDTDKRVYCWTGRFADESETDMAVLMLKHISPDKGKPTFIKEGSETLGFWNDIGDKEPYFTGLKRQDSLRIETRLFHCSNSSGKFTVEEIGSFTQEDLDTDDIMILDTYNEIFIWIGRGANEFEKKESYRTAYNYLESDPTGRNQDNTLIMVVRQGFEPLQFRGNFHPWDADLWNHGKTFAEIVLEVGSENAGVSLLQEETVKYFATYTYEELRRKNQPEGVDVRVREQYLSDEEFKMLFHMTKEEFQHVPTWKQVNMKKQMHLF